MNLIGSLIQNENNLLFEIATCENNSFTLKRLCDSTFWFITEKFEDYIKTRQIKWIDRNKYWNTNQIIEIPSPFNLGITSGAALNIIMNLNTNNIKKHIGYSETSQCQLKGCECGAKKASQILDYQVGHYSFCPVHHSKGNISVQKNK